MLWLVFVVRVAMNDELGARFPFSDYLITDQPKTYSGARLWEMLKRVQHDVGMVGFCGSLNFEY
ncbi:hypothetical protein [Roseivirga thermotolerans]|uniref:hypothetical protein n=1 Tax=Roseivirga thermotolerans TaxID=1758176 RepID=UPI00273F4DA7|nr:hypothetical protein [Roseivirga thermotolerans]